MSAGDKFNDGDRVFVKMKGYPAWPALITERIPGKVESYSVFFYGTYQSAKVKPDCMYQYNEETKAKFGKAQRKSGADFRLALEQIEGNFEFEPEPEVEQAPPPFRPEDEEDEGDLVIDEGASLPPVLKREDKISPIPTIIKKPKVQPKKIVKTPVRTVTSADPPNITEGASESSTLSTTPAKPRRGSKTNKKDLSLVLAQTPEVTPTPPVPLPEVKTRSGRQIKPKRFADEEVQFSTPPISKGGSSGDSKSIEPTPPKRQKRVSISKIPPVTTVTSPTSSSTSTLPPVIPTTAPKVEAKPLPPLPPLERPKVVPKKGVKRKGSITKAGSGVTPATRPPPPLRAMPSLVPAPTVPGTSVTSSKPPVLQPETAVEPDKIVVETTANIAVNLSIDEANDEKSKTKKLKDTKAQLEKEKDTKPQLEKVKEPKPQLQKVKESKPQLQKVKEAKSQVEKVKEANAKPSVEKATGGKIQVEKGKKDKSSIEKVNQEKFTVETQDVTTKEQQLEPRGEDDEDSRTSTKDENSSNPPILDDSRSNDPHESDDEEETEKENNLQEDDLNENGMGDESDDAPTAPKRMKVDLKNGTASAILAFNHDRPYFRTEAAAVEYDMATARTVLHTKVQLEVNETAFLKSVADSLPKSTVGDEKEQKIQERTEQIQKKVAQLRMEGELIEIIGELVGSLGLRFAYCDRALDLLDRLGSRTDVNTLALKKNPEVVEVIRKIQNYHGNVGEWSNLTTPQLEEFHVKAEMIREKAISIYQSFKLLFCTTPEKPFYETFNEEIGKFNETVTAAGISSEDVLGLYAEPTPQLSTMTEKTSEVVADETSTDLTPADTDTIVEDTNGFLREAETPAEG